MEKNNELLDKVTIFLIVMVSAILIFNQYQYYTIYKTSLVYFSAVLILLLVGLIAWLFMEKPHSKESHQSIAVSEVISKEVTKPMTFMEKVSYSLVAIVAILIVFNQVQISQASTLMGMQSGLTLKSTSTKTPVALTGDPTQDALAIVIPRGTPFYGEQLGVSFEDPIKSLEIIAQLDPAYGKNKVQLTQEGRDRYISILTTPTITCEYCCGVKTAVTKDARPTCGCKHAWAIRGLTAYLIKNYPDMSDDEIKKEVIKWKGLFFPKQMIQRYVQEVQSGQYTPDIAALLLDVDEEKLKSMKAAVASSGNPQGSSDAAASINELPSMVGGC